MVHTGSISSNNVIQERVPLVLKLSQETLAHLRKTQFLLKGEKVRNPPGAEFPKP